MNLPEPDIERFTFSLRVWHPTLAAEEIEARVGQQVRYKINAGETRKRSNGEPLEGARPVKFSLCVFADIDGPAASFEEALLSAARQLEDRGTAFSSLVAEGCDAQFFVGYFLGEANNGFSISPDLSALLARLGITLSICLYNHIE